MTDGKDSKAVADQPCFFSKMVRNSTHEKIG